MRTIALIPARYSSSRFPGKPLAMLGGERVIIRVCRRVEEAGIRPIVATDDERIKDAVEKGGYEAIMTSSHHKSGTDRIREALDKIGEATDPDVVLNVQGDEPFIRAEQLQKLSAVFQDSEVEIATLTRDYDSKGGIEGLEDPNLVKVAIGKNGDAVYFSRTIIPYIRGEEKEEWLKNHIFHTHIGVYAFRPNILRAITDLPEGELEKSERLEQLRWLENGYRIRAVHTEWSTIGIDTPQDLAAAEQWIKSGTFFETGPKSGL